MLELLHAFPSVSFHVFRHGPESSNKALYGCKNLFICILLLMTMKVAGFLFAIAMFSAIAFAQVDQIIVVSDTTSADYFIAKAAGDKSGSPVLIAANGEITDELKAPPAELNPQKIILSRRSTP